MDDSERVFSARDVQRVAGLSYRQINDWDSRSALPHARAAGQGWRRFSLRDIFVLQVLTEIKARFGIPLDRLQYVREFMLQEGANHFSAAVNLMAILGVGVWILTDLQETFIMDSEIEFADLMQHHFFGGDNPAGYVFVKVNPLVNQLLSTLKDPIHLPVHGRGYEIVNQLRRRLHAQGAGELKVLEAIRRGDYRKVEVTLNDGQIRTIRATADRLATQHLAQLLAEHPFQRVTVTMRDGRVEIIQQEVTERVPRSYATTGTVEEVPPDAD